MILTSSEAIALAPEMTILFGIIATLIGFFVVAKLPAWEDAAYRIESNEAGFTIAVNLEEGADKEAVEKILKDKGATEVSEEEKRI